MKALDVAAILALLFVSLYIVRVFVAGIVAALEEKNFYIDKD